MNLEYLKKILHYESEIGIWTWLISLSKRIQIGQEAGTINLTTGYRQIQIDKKIYSSSSLAWFYMTGEWPINEVDHADLNRLNDVWDNLRLASRSQNGLNKHVRKDSKLGVKGVRYRKTKRKFQARFRDKHLGYFETLEEAKIVYDKTILEYAGEFARF